MKKRKTKIEKQLADLIDEIEMITFSLTPKQKRDFMKTVNKYHVA